MSPLQLWVWMHLMARRKMYSIQHHGIKFVSDMRQLQVSGFLQILWFPLPWYNWNINESGVKHHNLYPNPIHLKANLWIFGASHSFAKAIWYHHWQESLFTAILEVKRIWALFDSPLPHRSNSLKYCWWWWCQTTMCNRKKELFHII